eukprot:gene5263-5927_t
MATGESLVVWRRCTPFCEKTVECPEHHELLQAIVNCTDQLGHLSNLEILKNCVEKYESIGWNKNDDIPDPVVSNRYPLIHWATSLGKCNALEWMVNSGFDPCVTVTGLGENALHRAILCLYKSRTKFTVKELKPKFSKIVSLMPQLLSLCDSVNRDTPLHTAASMLLNTEVRVSFFQVAVEVMASYTQRLSEIERTDILDAKNDDGDTALHILAGVADRSKVEYACSAINALVLANADKTLKNNLNLTPLDIAIAKGFDSIIDELVKITPAKPLSSSSSMKQSHQSGHHHRNSSPVSMVSRERTSPTRPSSNGSCTMVTPAEINGCSSKYSDAAGFTGKAGSPVSVKEEPSDDFSNGNHAGFGDFSLPDANSLLDDVAANSPLLKHLQEAGLLTEVSSLLLRAKVRDESHLKKIQQQAKDLDTQIRYKRNEIEKINQEVEALYGKRSRCDDEAGQLKKRLISCEQAIKEIPNKVANQKQS